MGCGKFIGSWMGISQCLVMSLIVFPYIFHCVTNACSISFSQDKSEGRISSHKHTPFYPLVFNALCVVVRYLASALKLLASFVVLRKDS